MDIFLSTYKSSKSDDMSIKLNGLSLVEKYSYGKRNSGNLIIKGDNNVVLPLLIDTYKNLIKCIYIDPPYNNGEKYNHYLDDKSHHEWIIQITNILKLLNPLLSEDGSIWISIDDKEMHYLKVAADNVFGRKNFITTIIWQQRTTRENRKVFSNNHEYLLVYAHNPKKFKETRNLLPLSNEVLQRYKNPDNDKRGPWQSISVNVQAGHATPSQFYNLIAPNGKVHVPPNGRCWIYNEERMQQEIRSNNIWFGLTGNSAPRLKKFIMDGTKGLTPETLWFADDVGTSKSAKKHILNMFPKDLVFDTPKPEELIKGILDIATNEGDLVLDCYLGSGSTASTAHKMKRKYIGIEVGDHIINLVSKRMRMVVDGESDGVSEEVNWDGGGGFDFFSLSK